MSQFSTISRAHREMQLDSWTTVIVDLHTALRIRRDHKDEMEALETGELIFATVHHFLNDWCRKNIKGGFAVKLVDPNLQFHFQRSSEAVRFKITWGGR